MKRQLLISNLLSVLVTLSCTLTLYAENNITYTATYNGNLTIGSDTLGDVTYKTVNYDGLSNAGAPGMPSLPIDYIRFSVPWNATNFSVTTELGNSTGYNYRDLVYPCQPPRMMSDTTPPTITLPDMSAYANYPQQNAWVVDEGFLAGENHIVTVAVMPFSYKLTSLSYLLEKYQQVNITLSYQQSNSLATYPIVNLNEHTKAAGYRLTESIVVNPNNVSGFAPQSMSDTLIRPYHAPSINSGLPEYPYLIITTPELLHSLRRLAAFKRQKGYNVKLATVDEIMHDTYAQYGDIINVNGVPTVTFSDSAGIIRQYLKLSKWFFGTKYLLLVGSEVPYRIQWKGLPFGTFDVPTDLYYSDLTGNWTHNSTIELYPDLFVGRLLAKNKSQVSNYTDKLFGYEMNPGRGDYTYLRKSLYLEPVGMFNYSKDIGNYMNQICPDSTIIREKPLECYPKGRDVIDSINTNKYGFWCFFNHGCPSCIITYGVNFYNKLYSDSFFCLQAIDSVKVLPFNGHDTEGDNALNNFENHGYEMISYSTSCETMPFDVKTEYAILPMNFGESFTTGKNYGGPAYLGNTRDGLNPSSKDLGAVFAKSMLDYSHRIGVAEAISKCVNNDENFGDYVALTHNLLGDPEFEMWSDTPQSYSNIVVERTNNSVIIRGIDSDSTIVAHYANNGQIGTDTISNTDVTLNSISPNSTIMIYKHNHIPYIVPMELQNVNLANNQYVIASDVRAGNSINSNRTSGDVIIPNGVEYEIEASGKVSLEDGFKVEKGATFAVYPSSF